MENIKITLNKKSGNPKGKIDVKAYVEVTEGRLVAKFTVVESEGKLYLNNPNHYVSSLKGTKLPSGQQHTGFIDHAYITDKAFKQEIIEEVTKLLKL